MICNLYSLPGVRSVLYHPEVQSKKIDLIIFTIYNNIITNIGMILNRQSAETFCFAVRPDGISVQECDVQNASTKHQ